MAVFKDVEMCYEISDFCRDADEVFVNQGCYVP